MKKDYSTMKIRNRHIDKGAAKDKMTHLKCRMRYLEIKLDDLLDKPAGVKECLGITEKKIQDIKKCMERTDKKIQEVKESEEHKQSN